MYAYVYKSWMNGDTMKQATPFKVQKKVENGDGFFKEQKRGEEQEWRFSRNKRQLKDRGDSF